MSTPLDEGDATETTHDIECAAVHWRAELEWLQGDEEVCNCALGDAYRAKNPKDDEEKRVEEIRGHAEDPDFGTEEERFLLSLVDRLKQERDEWRIAWRDRTSPEAMNMQLASDPYRTLVEERDAAIARAEAAEEALAHEYDAHKETRARAEKLEATARGYTRGPEMRLHRARDAALAQVARLRGVLDRIKWVCGSSNATERERWCLDVATAALSPEVKPDLATMLAEGEELRREIEKRVEPMKHGPFGPPGEKP